MQFIMKYVHEPKPGMFYYRRNGRYWGRLPGKPGSPEFSVAYAKIDASFTTQGISPADTGTFAAMVEAYLVSSEYRKNIKANTQSAYRADLDFLRGKVGKFRPDQIEMKHVLALRDDLADKPGKANTLIRTGRVLYKWGRGRGLCKTNPFDLKAGGQKALRLGEHQPWTARALEIFREKGRPHLVLALEMGLWLGQRQGDLIRIRWDDIIDGMIRVVQQKTGKELYLPVPAPLAEVLRNAPKSAVTILVNSKGTPWLKANPLAQAFGDELTRLGLNGFVFHGLRKSAAVAYAMVGCSTKEIAAITGQSDQMVAHYTKGVERGRLAKAAVVKLESANKKGRSRRGK